ncbi:MAG: hypothetical protein EPO21_09035 [Chloroflexota bacterium]|nr:MAG: hypothetical protein EPO21_09035 [Chloroflexota bacterium]
MGRAFDFEQAAVWKRAIGDYAPEFRRAIRDHRRWGMAKSMMMEGLARGFDLSTEEGLNRWFRTKQAEQIAEIETASGVAPGEKMSLLDRLRRAIGLAAAEGVSGTAELDTRRLMSGDLSDKETYYRPLGSGASSKRRGKKEKSRRKQAKASRRQSRH